VCLEIARGVLAFDCDLPKPIMLAEEIPITSNLSEDTFLSALEEMDHALLLVRMSAELNMERLELTPTPQAQTPRR
jgi:hypothetical protein